MWTKETEREFFQWALEERRCKPEDLFYKICGRYLFYLPKGIKGTGEVKQGRNALVGEFTEIWAENFLKPIAESFGLHVVRGAIVPELKLVGQRKADIALCRTSDMHQRLENIVAIVEVKMSIVWNWEWQPSMGEVICIGDFRTHQGRPSVLRSDTILKALGKAVEVRGQGFQGAFFVLCNSPISNDYRNQIDGCKQLGVIQGFFSVNPYPIDGACDEQTNPKRTSECGFLRWDRVREAEQTLHSILAEQNYFFSGYLSLEMVGRLIETACQEVKPHDKARRFLRLLREVSHLCMRGDE